MKGIIYGEIAKFFSGGKWLPPFLVVFFLGFLSSDQIIAKSINSQVAINIWDTYLAMMSNTIAVNMVMVLALAYATCDIVTKDTLTNYHWLVLTRENSRFRWWLAKLSSMFIIVALVMVVALSSSVFWALVQGVPFSVSLSPYAIGEGAVDFRFFPALDGDTNVLALVAAILLLASLALGSLMSVFVSLSLLVRKPFAIIGLVFVWALLDFTLWQYVLWWQYYISPSMKTMLMTHFEINTYTGAPLIPPLWTSITFFIGLTLAALVFGWSRIRRADF